MAGEVRDGDGDAEDRDEELAHAHERGAPEQEGAPPVALDTPHPGERHARVDDVGRDVDEERIFDACNREERDTVCGRVLAAKPYRGAVLVKKKAARTVGYEVYARELLPRLQRDAGEGAESNLVARGAEAVDIRALAHLPLAFEGSDNVSDFALHFRMIRR